MIDFLKYRYICMTSSAIALVAGFVLYFSCGGFKYNIDFTGGSAMHLKFDAPIEIAALRTAIKQKGWSDAEIQLLNASGTQGREVQVVVAGKTESIEEEFKNCINNAFVGNHFEISMEHIGAQAGQEVKTNAVLAVLLSLLVLLLYLAIRYQYAYALGAVVAVAHDLIAISIYFLIAKEGVSLNVLAAMLAMLGYSVNDTIIIFSRIRENQSLMRGKSLIEIVNKSINQTLRRTILTSFATLLSVLTLFFLGGEALRPMMVTMIIGIIVGTYSSIFVASPIMIAFSKENA